MRRRQCLNARAPTSQGNDLLRRVHDSTLCAYRPSHDVVGFCKVDDDYLLLAIVLRVQLSRSILDLYGPCTHLLSCTDEAVALHGQGIEANRAGLDPHSRELGRADERRANQQLHTMRPSTAMVAHLEMLRKCNRSALHCIALHRTHGMGRICCQRPG